MQMPVAGPRERRRRARTSRGVNPSAFAAPAPRVLLGLIASSLPGDSTPPSRRRGSRTPPASVATPPPGRPPGRSRPAPCPRAQSSARVQIARAFCSSSRAIARSMKRALAAGRLEQIDLRSRQRDRQRAAPATRRRCRCPRSHRALGRVAQNGQPPKGCRRRGRRPPRPEVRDGGGRLADRRASSVEQRRRAFARRSASRSSAALTLVQAFHVKRRPDRQPGRTGVITILRKGSSPSLWVSTSVRSWRYTCTIFRSAAAIESSSTARP